MSAWDSSESSTPARVPSEEDSEDERERKKLEERLDKVRGRITFSPPQLLQSTATFCLTEFKQELAKKLFELYSSNHADDSDLPELSMIVEDAELLRGWLAAILQPLCDADPSALAKYVLALIKKDKSEAELRQSMSDQLEVFLQQETQKFVDRLFELLKTKEYLTKTAPPLLPKKDPSLTAAVSMYNLDSSSTSATSTTCSSTASSVINFGGDGMDTSNNNANVAGDIEASIADKDENIENKNSNRKDRRDDDRDRNRRRRSRSPLRRRSARSRSRGRDKKYHPRKNWRSTRRTRSRSPLLGGSGTFGRNRTRSPPPGRHRRHSRSRSRSPKNSNHGAELNVDKPSVQSVVIRAGGEKSDKSNRCRDFDEKGLCMRGELCPFDHGADPVVLEDVVLPVVANTSAPSSAGGNQYNAPNILSSTLIDEYRLDSSQGSSISSRPGSAGAPAAMNEYYPDNPGMEGPWGIGMQQFRPRMGFEQMMRGHPMMGRGMGQFPHSARRDLINVPVMGMPMEAMPPHHMGNYRMHLGGRGRGRFDHSRLGYKAPRNYANCSLEVKKIPREHNNIMDLNSHFQKFGKIVNIQINFENDTEAALVTFSMPSEAQAAYRSTEAVLNNRFIRVFWHSKEKENEESSEEPTRVSAMDRLGGIEGEDSESQEKILVSGNNITKTVYNPALPTKKTDAAAEKIQAVEAIKKSQEMLAAQEATRRKQLEKKREAMKMINDLRKRKQDMLAEQIQAQKKLISKLESGKSTMKQEEVHDCMTLIKSIQEQIEKMKKDLEENIPKITTSVISKEEVDREMLDAELELYNREQEGGDTFALEQKILELRSKARHLGYPYRGRGFRGSSRGFAGRGGRGARQVHRAMRTVDRRPTRIRVTGFPVARLPEILPHFSQFGNINEYETDTVTPSMILNFDTRKCAEQAMNNGKIFGDSELEITWVVVTSELGGGDSQNNGDGNQESNGTTMEEDELGDILANEILLTFEEDEEDEDGNRSWRR